MKFGFRSSELDVGSFSEIDSNTVVGRQRNTHYQLIENRTQAEKR
jgi:hypothetical protein